MSSVYVNEYVSDIPLKRPAETFVDDPASLDEVFLDELEFDLSHDIKDINKLHVFHAVAILNAMLLDLIRLSTDRALFDRFRREKLKAYSIDLDELSTVAELSASFHDDDLPLPVESIRPLGSYRMPSVDYLDTQPVPESLLGEKKTDGAFILTESLLKLTSFDMIANPITEHNHKRLYKEVLFHSNAKTRQQAEHLLKAFALTKVPRLTVEQFLLRIKTYLPNISVSVYIHSAHMLFKLCVLLDVAPLTHLNVYRFILALLRCLIKTLEDVYQTQKSFATVGGVALKDLCKIEVSFLYLFNFKLMCSEFILDHFLMKEFVALRRFCRQNLPPEETKADGVNDADTGIN
ncbi:hypothetical protein METBISCDRAFT_14712 [Metschnikowia bicuspidata]|uniref:Cyclin-domain-containing protein n=1 Tax=Metschnikowia bicuspidata TaxID=27322 RepID=A0A4P9ZDT4_9ASCO|nr:hypothetical protein METBISCDRAFT_14712 [Metschnikowia bicuspidata]